MEEAKRWKEEEAHSPQKKGENSLPWDFLKLINKRWEVFFYCFPEDVQIDIEIGMNKAISHTNDI